MHPMSGESVESTKMEKVLLGYAGAPSVCVAGDSPVAKAERDTLIIKHMDLVHYVARSIQATLPSHVDGEELESAGYMGLIDAAEKFDTSKHVQFRSYAQFRIRGAMLDSLRVSDWSPRALRRKGRMVESAMQAVSQREGRVATEAEIAEELTMTVAEYQQLLGDLHSLDLGSIHASHKDGYDDEKLSYVPSPMSDEPLFRCMQSELKQHLSDAIEALAERERLVLTLSYFEEMTLREIAAILGIGEARVSQIRSSAILHLRNELFDLASKVTRPKVPSRLSSAA